MFHPTLGTLARPMRVLGLPLEVSVSIDGIGTLTNPVAGGAAPA